MKRYYCDVCDKEISNVSDRYKVKLTECWDGSTYRNLVCEECFNNILALLKSRFAQKAPE